MTCVQADRIILLSLGLVGLFSVAKSFMNASVTHSSVLETSKRSFSVLSWLDLVGSFFILR